VWAAALAGRAGPAGPPCSLVGTRVACPVSPTFSGPPTRAAGEQPGKKLLRLGIVGVVQVAGVLQYRRGKER
jgi:hypothetical protein